MKRVINYSKENLTKLIAESSSYKEILIKMGLRAAGGNYGVLKKYISHYELDASKLIAKSKEQKLQQVSRMSIKIPLEKILIEHSDFNRSHLKQRLYDEGLKIPICEMEGCGQSEIWLGKKISLILDHKNGVHDDNRIENLRILCPNCNATLDTHCGKNNKGKIKKLNSKKKINLERRKIMRPPYEELLTQVKNNGYAATGRKYGVADNSIRKWLKSYEKHGV